MKTETFKKSFKIGAFWKRIVFKTLRFRLASEKGDEEICRCDRFQS